MSGDARLYRPRRVAVLVDGDGAPTAIAGSAVEGYKEEWVVEDRWWTPQPVRRHYYELVLVDGRCVVVFRDLEQDSWFEQRA